MLASVCQSTAANRRAHKVASQTPAVAEKGCGPVRLETLFGLRRSKGRRDTHTASAAPSVGLGWHRIAMRDLGLIGRMPENLLIVSLACQSNIGAR